ncbi:hypothetical protein QAD02_009621 [Eretmocerus hayati]|uniref:Uncharacterized protein n=1 Tax=Eretmocerus hayati TaxID=131215 RepID=A0ACC2N9Z3_9HYME|nr:hypothetical protein QAD02_009621 [Eretmocerus hayati]
MDEEELAQAKLKNRWTEGEKRALLKGLKMYGTDDIQKLMTLLPRRSETSIIQMIRKYQSIAVLGKREMNSPLDVWMRSGIFNNENSLVPKALLYISLFENFPPPEETAGFDLKKAYRYLYEISKGSPMSHLPEKTAEMLKQLMVTVDVETQEENKFSTTDYLIGKLCEVESKKCYKRRRE